MPFYDFPTPLFLMLEAIAMGCHWIFGLWGTLGLRAYTRWPMWVVAALRIGTLGDWALYWD